MQEEMELQKVKKNGVCGVLLKIILVLGMIHGALLALGKYMAKRARELEEGNEGQKKKNYMAFMSGKDIRIGREEVEKISIQSCMGGVNLDLTGAEIRRDMKIDIQATMSGVAIKVPPMVRVELDGTNVVSGFANMVPVYEAEELPTIRIYAECVMSGISVEMVPDREQ